MLGLQIGRVDGIEVLDELRELDRVDYGLVHAIAYHLLSNSYLGSHNPCWDVFNSHLQRHSIYFQSPDISSERKSLCSVGIHHNHDFHKLLLCGEYRRHVYPSTAATSISLAFIESRFGRID